jgi:hypothetical protein
MGVFLSTPGAAGELVANLLLAVCSVGAVVVTVSYVSADLEGDGFASQWTLLASFALVFITAAYFSATNKLAADADADPIDWRVWRGLVADLKRRAKTKRRGSELLHTGRTLVSLPRLLGVNPAHSFTAATEPPPMDYTTIEAWAAHPDRPASNRKIEDPNHAAIEPPPGDGKRRPGGDLPKVPPPAHKRQAACFFVHDTTYNPPEAAAVRARDGLEGFWNAPVGPVPHGTLLGSAAHPTPAGVEHLAAKVDEMVELRARCSRMLHFLQ